MSLDTDSGPHSRYNLRYHLIFVTKYRENVISNEIGEELLEQLNKLSDSSDYFTIIEVNHEKDHVHILFKTKPSATLSKIVNKLKGATSRKLRNNHQQLNQLPSLWSPSYYIATSGNVTLNTLKNYVEKQGDNHE